MSDYQTVGLLDRRTTGMSDYRADPRIIATLPLIPNRFFFYNRIRLFWEFY